MIPWLVTFSNPITARQQTMLTYNIEETLIDIWENEDGFGNAIYFMRSLEYEPDLATYLKDHDYPVYEDQ